MKQSCKDYRMSWMTQGYGAELCFSHRLVTDLNLVSDLLSIVLGEEMCGDGGGQWTITCTPPSTGL